MLQLLVPNVDNEKIFEKIAERKTYKNSHCKECEDDRSICSICCHGKRGKMLHLKKRVFERYKVYFENRDNLVLIQPLKLMVGEEKKIMREAYESSKTFQKVKKQIFDLSMYIFLGLVAASSIGG